jgi:chorismate dehydratase
MSKPVLAGISYLNSAPYFSPFRLGVMESSFEIRLGTPAEANLMVENGTAVAGLISTIAWARALERRRDPGDEGLIRWPGYEIASEGEVGSISFYMRGAIEEIRSVAVTNESATSIEMLRILLSASGMKARFIVTDRPLERAANGDVDAALLIGDAALAPAREGWTRIDMGHLWQEKFRSPMVYAVLAVRGDLGTRAAMLRSELDAALAWSRDHLDEVIAEWYARGAVGLGVHLENWELKAYLARFDRARRSTELEAGLNQFLTRWKSVRSESCDLI